jgi:RNA polymerase sigma factor (sigma-70 family)
MRAHLYCAARPPCPKATPAQNICGPAAWFGKTCLLFIEGRSLRLVPRPPTKDAMTKDAQDGSPGVREEDMQVWMTRYGPGLKRYFQKRVNAAEAEELVQDVFLAMHTRGDGAPVDNIQGYLFTIAANLLSKRQKKLGPDTIEDAADVTEGFSPERIVISRQEAVRAIVAIKRLPPRTREAFVLHRFEDMTYPTIARRLGISVSAVSKLVARALAHIAEEMRKES